MNACGHHHIGHIGILGVDKNKEEWYQVTVGGREGEGAALGRVIGPAFAAGQIPDVIQRLLEVYLAARAEGEPFIEVVERIGLAPFKARVYGAAA